MKIVNHSVSVTSKLQEYEPSANIKRLNKLTDAEKLRCPLACLHFQTEVIDSLGRVIGVQCAGCGHFIERADLANAIAGRL